MTDEAFTLTLTLVRPAPPRTVAVGEHQGPSTVLGPSVLDWPQQLVEVEAIAVTSAPAAAR